MAEAASQQVRVVRPGPRPWLCDGLPAPLRLLFWLRGSSGKIGFLQYFLGFFLKVGFLHKRKDTRTILLKTVLVRVSCIQNTQIRGETTAKVFGKIDTFWTYRRLVQINHKSATKCRQNI
jgi:hypothetical protein